jgi:hypothetical protein
MSHIKIIKRKARGFFKKEDQVIIKDTVISVHKIITDASILLRAYYLRWFQTFYPLEDEHNVLEFEHYHVSMACNVVQGVTSPPVRGAGPEQNAKIAIYEKMLDEYDKLYGRVAINPDVATSLSLSHILTYSIENLLTAYTNNIQSHFSKYTKRYIRCDMLSKGADKTEAKKVAAFYTNTYLYDSPFDVEQGFLESYGLDLASYSFLFPPKMTTKTRAWDLKIHPWVYLPKMVWINQALETDFPNIAAKERKLFNPLPFHSSFVPMHIRLDTSGLSQLLMTKAKIKDFKNLYFAQHNVSLNMKSKGDMLRSFDTLFGRRAASIKESGLYATELWSFLTNLKTCRHWTELQGVIRKNDPKKTCWMFDNSIVTDGISVSFQVIDEKKFGRKVLSERNKVDDSPKDPDEFKEIVTDDELKNSKVLGCDPGKRDILAMTDGFKTLCYTKGQRDTDTHKRTRLNDCLKRRLAHGLEDYETQVMNRYQKRSCHPEAFRRYACSRKRIATKFTNCYQHPVFREFKFLVYSKTKSSEDRFKHKIFETFKDSQTKVGNCASDIMKANASKEVTKYQDFLIGWGDWGKKPNAIKCGCPTPGVGIRRRFESLFKTTTVPEHYSSQECPCCKGRCLKKARIGESNPVTKHHLLRCTNENCQSRWWNRNVVGAFNILSRLLDGKTLSSNETTGSGLRRRRPPKPRT